MWLFKKKNNAEEIYLNLRTQLLNSKPTPEIREYMKGHPVYAALVDMGLDDYIVSLACFIDGTTSMYFSTGGGQLGLGQRYITVRDATTAFLFSSEQILDKLTKTKTFPLPDKNRNIVYLATEDSVYMQELNMDRFDQLPKELKFLNFLYQNVISAIREAQS